MKLLVQALNKACMKRWTHTYSLHTNRWKCTPVHRLFNINGLVTWSQWLSHMITMAESHDHGGLVTWSCSGVGLVTWSCFLLTPAANVHAPSWYSYQSKNHQHHVIRGSHRNAFTEIQCKPNVMMYMCVVTMWWCTCVWWLWWCTCVWWLCDDVHVCGDYVMMYMCVVTMWWCACVWWLCDYIHVCSDYVMMYMCVVTMWWCVCISQSLHCHHHNFLWPLPTGVHCSYHQYIVTTPLMRSTEMVTITFYFTLEMSIVLCSISLPFFPYLLLPISLSSSSSPFLYPPPSPPPPPPPPPPPSLYPPHAPPPGWKQSIRLHVVCSAWHWCHGALQRRGQASTGAPEAGA